MQASNEPNANKSQFFITFGKSDGLYRKHTLFGKVVGDSIYNLMSMEKLETDAQDRPLNPPVIHRAVVVDNPFPDIFPRDISIVRPDIVVKEKKPEKKREGVAAAAAEKKKKNFNKLSFIEEEEGQGYEVKKVGLPEGIMPAEESTLEYIKKREEDVGRLARLKREEKTGEDKGKEKGESLARKAGEEILEGRLEGVEVVKDKETGKVNIRFRDGLDGGSSGGEEESDSESESSSEYEDEEVRLMREKQKDIYENIVFDSIKYKEDKTGSLDERGRQRNEEDSKLLSSVELKRYKYTKDKGDSSLGKRDQQDTMSKLNSFISRIKQNSHGETHWMNSKLKFHIDSSNAYDLQTKKKDII